MFGRSTVCIVQEWSVACASAKLQWRSLKTTWVSFGHKMTKTFSMPHVQWTKTKLVFFSFLLSFPLFVSWQFWWKNKQWNSLLILFTEGEFHLCIVSHTAGFSILHQKLLFWLHLRIFDDQQNLQKITFTKIPNSHWILLIVMKILMHWTHFGPILLMDWIKMKLKCCSLRANFFTEVLHWHSAWSAQITALCMQEWVGSDIRRRCEYVSRPWVL